MSIRKTAAAAAESEDLCIVCYKNVDLYSIGACDHPVCYECSTRMRVLCKQKECPICRSEMPEVIFTREIKPFTELQPNLNISDSKYGLQFCSRSIQDAYYRLLEIVCQKCSRQFRNFGQLKDHMRKEHELYYCDLCVDNLKIFAFERKCYNRSELATHRRKGDEDNKSHRGHPLCEFCDQRYMDNDDLFRHLRRDHLYCHFCDADGKHQYYPSYEELRAHFRQDHYVCEEGECINEHFTSVFRSDIDFKAHVASVHSKHLSRGATKQARTLEVEFNFKPRGNHDSKQNNHRNNRNAVPEEEEDEGAYGYDEPGGSRPPTRQLSQSDFPTLGKGTESAMTATRTSVTFTSKMSKPKFNNEEFPSLGGGSTSSAKVVPRSNITISNKVKKADDFPTLGTPRNITITKSSANTVRNSAPPSTSLSCTYGKTLANSSAKSNCSTIKAETSSTGSSSGMVKLTVNPERAQRSNLSIHVNTSVTSIQVRPKSSSEAFPALGGGSAKSTAPEAAQWVVPKAKKQQEPKSSKVAKAPTLPPSSLADFPSLGKKVEKKSYSVTMPIRQAAGADNKQEAPTNNNNNVNKKEKKDKKKDAASERNCTNGPSAKEKDGKTEAEMKSNKNLKNKKNKKTENNDSDAYNTNVSNGVKCENSTSLPNNVDYASTSLDTALDNSGDAKVNSALIKKTSTLKIGTLESSEKKQTPLPPGFKMRPPPGFGFPGTIAAGNDLTFTNSSGQSYSILPNNNQPEHTYAQPVNFQARNANLIRMIIALLKTQEALNEFKSFSDLFRSGAYPGEKYYDYCQVALGDSFDKIFPELLVLLPDISKQQDLYKVHVGSSKAKNLEQCATCQQIIFTHELKHHINTHYMENHFPSLGGEQAPTFNAWRK